MVGSDALMRLSLVISLPPLASGTLKSTRMKTRLPFRSRSRIESVIVPIYRSNIAFEGFAIIAAMELAELKHFLPAFLSSAALAAVFYWRLWPALLDLFRGGPRPPSHPL